MRPPRILAALSFPTLLVAGCSERTPTGPAATAGAAGTAAASTVQSGRSSPRPLAPRAAESDGPIGTWGGNDTNLTIGLSSAIIEFSCAHGTINQPFAANASGLFDLAGTFVKEGPGPVRDPLADHPARYLGSTNGATMTLNVTLTDTGETFGPFVLTFGKAGRVFKCL